MEKENKKNGGLGIAALVLSIFAVLFCFIPYVNFISYVFGVIALIFSVVTLLNKKVKNGLAIAAIVLTVIAMFMASSMNKATDEAIESTSKELDKITGNATEEVLKNDVEVTLGKFKASKDEYGLIDSEMEVTIKNITSETKSYTFHIEAVSENGDRINDDYIYVNDLGAGQTTKEKIFEYTEDAKYEAMKKATFKIVEASVN